MQWPSDGQQCRGVTAVLQGMQQSSQATAQCVADMGAVIRQLGAAAANATQYKQQ